MAVSEKNFQNCFKKWEGNRWWLTLLIGYIEGVAVLMWEYMYFRWGWGAETYAFIDRFIEFILS